MADIFISYAREDRPAAAALAAALEGRGWSVWWDREILAGDSFDQVIERELATARAVVVLWSGHSVESEWVKNEAADAAERGLLVPASLDGVKLPLEFRRRQAADLGRWRGERGHEGFEALCQGLAAKVAPPATRPAEARPAPARVGAPGGGRRALVAVLLLVVVGAAIYAWRSRAVVSAEPSVGNQLSDVVAGTYFGGVVSDSRGHSQSDVTVTVTKLGARRVRVSADYDRMATVDVDLRRAMDSILNAGGSTSFMFERNGRLELSYDGLSYDGRKRP